MTSHLSRFFCTLHNATNIPLDTCLTSLSSRSDRLRQRRLVWCFGAGFCSPFYRRVIGIRFRERPSIERCHRRVVVEMCMVIQIFGSNSTIQAHTPLVQCGGCVCMWFLIVRLPYSRVLPILESQFSVCCICFMWHAKQPLYYKFSWRYVPMVCDGVIGCDGP